MTVGVGPGGIAFGYKDGYRDQGLTNGMPGPVPMRPPTARAANKAHYYEWKHDRDKGEGWRETDRYRQDR